MLSDFALTYKVPGYNIRNIRISGWIPGSTKTWPSFSTYTRSPQATQIQRGCRAHHSAVRHSGHRSPPITVPFEFKMKSAPQGRMNFIVSRNNPHN